MEVKFGEEGSVPVEIVAQTAPSSEPKTVTSNPNTNTNTAVATRRLILGDSLPQFKDVMLPRLNIVQFSGALKDSFQPGALVWNQTTVLFTPPVIDKASGNVKVPALPPVTLYVIGVVAKRFAEKVQGGIGGLILGSEEEVRANGGTLDFNEYKLKRDSGMKRFEPMDDILVAVQRPEHCADDGTVFVHEVDGAKLALGLWTLKGTSYTEAMKKVIYLNRLTGCLREGFPTFSFAVSTRIKSFENNTYYVPVCVPKAKSSPAFMEFAHNIIGA